MDNAQILHARDALRSRTRPRLLAGLQISPDDVGKIYVMNASKTSGQIMSREEFLALDVEQVGGWYEIDEFLVTRPGHGPMHMQTRDGAKLLQQVMQENGIPFFFGPQPAEPNPVYPVPHMPDQNHLDKAALAICQIARSADYLTETREQVARMLLLMLYEHGYMTGGKHAEKKK
jgi:hypothetical protein